MYDDTKTTFLYNPVETDSFINKEKDSFIKPIFGRHSRPDMYKWSPINVQILPLIKNEIPDAKFHVIGLPDDYRAAIKRMGCEGMVVEYPTTNSQEEIAKFLNGLTVFTHGAMIGESFGLNIAEAMATGLPVVTHYGGDGAQAELVRDNINGYVVDQNDIRKYADAVIALLKNPDLAYSMGGYGTEFAKEFQADKVTKKLEEIFINLYNKKKL
jgi:glycosyltransferase involved in cell wall biosynthesis